ncbi:hypothetical protein Lumi_019 [Xylophilus phage Lumi]|nr:hypothetical protein Lumi_019 [Xylophilus phage Lumi]
MTLAFDLTMTQIQRTLFWEITWTDIRRKMRLYLANKQYEIAQQHQTLSAVVASAFGGKAENQTSTGRVIPENTRVLSDESDVDALRKMFG